MRYIAYGADGSVDSLRLIDGPQPVPAAGQILIEVHYAGVNRPDLLQRQGAYAPPPGASPILGLEVAGTVAALGAGVSEWRSRRCGLRTRAGWRLRRVLRDQRQPRIAGSGGPEPGAGSRAARGMVYGLGQSGRPRQLARAASGCWYTAAPAVSDWPRMQLAQHVGAQALVTVGTEDKARFCRDYGALAAINYRTEDFVARTLELTDGARRRRGARHGRAPYVERNLRILRRDGRLIFIAFQQGNRCELDLSPVMFKRLRITGSTMRPRTVAEKAAIRDALARNIWPTLAAEPHKTHLHAVIPWQQASDAHRLMQSSLHIGKIVLCVRP